MQDEVLRDEKGRFKTSGNPGGRTKGLSITALIDDAVTKEDWRQIIIVLKKLALRGNLKAIEILADRRFGKATQPVAGDEESPLKVIVEYVRDTPAPV